MLLSSCARAPCQLPFVVDRQNLPTELSRFKPETQDIVDPKQLSTQIVDFVSGIASRRAPDLEWARQTPGRFGAQRGSFNARNRGLAGKPPLEQAPAGAQRLR